MTESFTGKIAINVVHMYTLFKSNKLEDAYWKDIFLRLDDEAREFLEEKAQNIQTPNQINQITNTSEAPVANDEAKYLREFSYLISQHNPLKPSKKYTVKKAENQRLADLYSSGIGCNFNTNEEEAQFLFNEFENYTSNAKEIEYFHNVGKSAYYVEEQIVRGFPGMKFFSARGMEGGIVATTAVIQKINHKNVVLATAHRGRIAITSTILGKPIEKVINMLRNPQGEKSRFRDVIYHWGYDTKTTIMNSDFHICMPSNASHLESVYPIALGIAKNTNAIPITIHGDAAFSGQGVVNECLNMLNIDGYKNPFGGVGIIFNNQIGFTAEEKELRSDTHAASICKGHKIPYMLVNGMNIESIVKAAHVAASFVRNFKKQIFLEVYGFRAFGHNEGDEPRFTNPVLYKQIQSIKNIFTVTDKNFKPIDFKAKELPVPQVKSNKIKNANILEIAQKISDIPSNVEMHKKLSAIIDQQKLENQDSTLQWGFAELIAFGVLMQSGINIRFTGEDASRGTFSSRNSNIIDQETGEKYNRLSKITEAKFEIYNSPLSEFGVCGFEYGHSLSPKKQLTIWEAQFGDFSNGMQIIIDQYIMSGKEKWSDVSNLILLLPHGAEGQGPEHTSARPERFLQLCTKDNVYVANPTTPANYYHILIQQAENNDRPLIVLSPKSLLRHKQCVSTLKDLKSGKFESVIHKHFNNKLLVICSGKICYELEALEVSTLRIEMLYPFPKKVVVDIMKKYKTVVYCQEEPYNMGYAPFIKDIISVDDIISRPASSSPAEPTWEFKNNQDSILQAIKNKIK